MMRSIVIWTATLSSRRVSSRLRKGIQRSAEHRLFQEASGDVAQLIGIRMGTTDLDCILMVDIL